MSQSTPMNEQEDVDRERRDRAADLRGERVARVLDDDVRASASYVAIRPPS